MGTIVEGAAGVKDKEVQDGWDKIRGQVEVRVLDLPVHSWEMMKPLASHCLISVTTTSCRHFVTKISGGDVKYLTGTLFGRTKCTSVEPLLIMEADPVSLTCVGLEDKFWPLAPKPFTLAMIVVTLRVPLVPIGGRTVTEGTSFPEAISASVSGSDALMPLIDDAAPSTE